MCFDTCQGTLMKPLLCCANAALLIHPGSAVLHLNTWCPCHSHLPLPGHTVCLCQGQYICQRLVSIAAGGGNVMGVANCVAYQVLPLLAAAVPLLGAHERSTKERRVAESAAARLNSGGQPGSGSRGRAARGAGGSGARGGGAGGKRGGKKPGLDPMER